MVDKIVMEMKDFNIKFIIYNSTIMSKAKNIKQTVIEDSGDDSDSSLPIVPQKPTKKHQVEAKKATKNPPKQESEEEEDTPIVAKKPTKQIKTQNGAVKKVVPPTKKPVKQASSQEESQEEAPKKVVKAKSPVQKVVAPAKKQVRQSSSEESSEEKPKKVVKAKSPVQKAVVPKKKAPTSSEESESEEVPAPKAKGVKQVQKVASPALKAKSPVQKPVAKKPVAESSSEESSEQKPAPKAVQKVKSPLQKAKSPVQKAVVPKKAVTSSEQSEEEVKPKKGGKKVVAKVPSESEDESEQVKPIKKAIAAPVKAAKGKPQKVVESEEEQEQLAPKPKGKGKHVPEPEAMVDEDEEGEFQICVKGLSFQAFEDDVKELFNQFGNVVTVRLLTREDGKSRGLAFVKFSKKSSFNQALELNQSEQFGRPITVEESLGKKQNDGGFKKNNFGDNKGGFNKFGTGEPAKIESPTLFIGGLSYQSTKESIADYFSSIGPVMNARIVTDRETGKPRGFGYVEFQDVETAKKAYDTLNNGNLDGRQIRLDAASQRDKPAGGFGGGQGGYGGGQGGYGGSQGGFGAPRGAPRSSNVSLSFDDKNAKKGALGTFQGKKITF